MNDLSGLARKIERHARRLEATKLESDLRRADEALLQDGAACERQYFELLRRDLPPLDEQHEESLERWIRRVRDLLEGISERHRQAATREDAARFHRGAREHLPKMFVGASSDGMRIVAGIDFALKDVLDTTCALQGGFGLTDGTLASLVEASKRYSFAVLVATSDVTTEHGAVATAKRDNLCFLLGVFLARLPPERVFLVADAEVENLPFDLGGASPVLLPVRTWDTTPEAVAPLCARIRGALPT